MHTLRRATLLGVTISLLLLASGIIDAALANAASNNPFLSDSDIPDTDISESDISPVQDDNFEKDVTVKRNGHPHMNNLVFGRRSAPSPVISKSDATAFCRSALAICVGRKAKTEYRV